jgi:hypothetical protein
MLNFLYDSTFQTFDVLILLSAVSYLKRRKVPMMEIFHTDFQTLRHEMSYYFIGSYRYLIFLFLCTTLFLAIYVAPNNTDALGYHIARAMFWAQNHNLFHFPTEFTPQLYYNVLSEYCFLHLYLLTGSDYYFNGVHWFAMLIILITSSKVLQLWGSKKSIQGLGLMFTMVIPQVILQSTSSQNDLLSASYFLVCIYYGYRICVEKFSYSDYLWGLTAFILGGFTKYSIFILGSPLIIFFGLYQFWRNPSRAVWLGIISFLFFIGIFGMFFYRNYMLMTQIIAPSTNSPLFIGSYTSELMNWKTFISNFLKISGNHLALPIGFWNSSYDQLVGYVHRLIGFPLNSPLNSFGDYSTSFTIGEDFSGNFIHFLSICFLIPVLLWRRSDWRLPQVRLFALLIIGFCVYVEIFKWQRFHARTQMAFFVASAPLVIFFIAKKWELTEAKIKFLAWVFLLQGLPFLIFNSIKPIIPISYFVKRNIHYLPSSFSSNQSDSALTKKLLQLHIYKVGPDSQWIKLADLSKSQRKAGFDILDTLHVFEQDKLWIGSMSERFSHYVLYNQIRYQELNQIFDLIGQNRKHIGFHSYSSFVSPFFIMGKNRVGKDFQMRYVQYSKLFRGSKNTVTDYQYDVILTDDPYFVNRLPKNIGKVIYLKTWIVILLDKPSNQVFWK